MKESFFLGVCVGALVVATILGFVISTDRSIHKEAQLPAKCEPGNRVLMTTAPHPEYYECEAHWVKK